MNPNDPNQPQQPQYQPQQPMQQPQYQPQQPMGNTGYVAPSASVSPYLGLIGVITAVAGIIAYPFILNYADSYWVLLVATLLGLAGAGLGGFAFYRSGKLNLTTLAGFVLGLIVVCMSISYIMQASISSARVKSAVKSSSSSTYETTPSSTTTPSTSGSGSANTPYSAENDYEDYINSLSN